MKTLLALAAVLVGAHVAPGMERPWLAVPFTEEAIAVDGRLDEGAWAQAARFGPAVAIVTGAETEERTVGRMLYDRQFLYIAIVAEAEPAEETITVPRDSGAIHGRHDNVDIQIAPNADGTPYWQFIVDRFGNVYDGHRTLDGQGQLGAAWDGEWQAAARQTETGWAAEIAIPFSDFEMDMPDRGDVWRIRVGRNHGRDGIIMWPLNPTASFHTPEADAILYFGDRNLLGDAGTFAYGEEGQAPPRPWAVNQPDRGTVQVVADEEAVGGKAVLLAKTDRGWFPQLWSRGMPLAEGGIFEHSARLRALAPGASVLVRMDTRVEGERIRMNRTVEPGPEYERFALRFVVPQGAGPVRVGFSPGSQDAALQAHIDDVVLCRVVDEEHAFRQEFFAPDYSPEADPAHGLESFLDRAGEKPWDLFWQDGALATQRLVFRDKTYGTQLWMMDNSPVSEPSRTASIWPPWNRDGSRLYMEGTRLADGGRTPLRRRWAFNADYSKLEVFPAVEGRHVAYFAWDMECPDTYYYHRPGFVVKGNMATGEAAVLGEWERLPIGRERMMGQGLTKDNRYVFALQGYDRNVDMLPFTLGDEQVPAGLVGECEERGTILRVKIGMRVDTQTGRVERVAVPRSGHEEYLKAFYSGRVQFPEGVVVPQAETLDEMFRVYALYPFPGHGHTAPSPDEEYMATDYGPGVPYYRVRDGQELRRVIVSPNGAHYHICWFRTHRFFVTWIRGWQYGSFSRPVHGNTVAQVFTDGTWQPICDTKHVRNLAYSGSDFANLSPDATKIHFGSNMTGLFKIYVAVVSRPQPPRAVRWSAERQAVRLDWQAPPRSRETRGYLVYRSERSGDGYELMTPEPVQGTVWRDATVQRGRPYYYVVTRLEHSGLESRFSAEAARAGVGVPAGAGGPLLVYVEPEDALADLYVTDFPGLAKGVDRLGASDWQYIYRHPEAERGEATLDVHVPADGQYYVWARIRSSARQRPEWRIAIGGQAVEVGTAAQEWTWTLAQPAPVALSRGEAQMVLSTGDEGAQMDLICLATDPDFRPEGPRPEPAAPPAPVSGLAAENVRERANRLSWRASPSPLLSHYNVYASAEPFDAPEQRHLVASPTRGEFIDWGLRAETNYHYAVTAVDRWGNESAPVRAQVATPAAETPLATMELAFMDAERTGEFEVGEAEATRSAQYVLAESEENSVRWRVSVPHEGTYFFWPRFLARGPVTRDGPHRAIRPNVRVRLNGRAITSLGHSRRMDMCAPDAMVRPGSDVAPLLWTWQRPGLNDLQGVRLPAGEHELTMENVPQDVRYDVLVLTNDPAFLPPDGRLLSAD